MSLLLNGGGLDQIRTITTELNKALRGNEPAVRDLLGRLNTFVGGVDRQKDEITTALVNVDKLAATLNQQKQTIINTLGTMPQALKILKDSRAPVRRTADLAVAAGQRRDSRDHDDADQLHVGPEAVAADP